MSTSVLDDGHAKGVLIGGVLFSVLLGLFVFLLGAGASRSAPRAPKAPRPQKRTRSRTKTSTTRSPASPTAPC